MADHPELQAIPRRAHLASAQTLQDFLDSDLGKASGKRRKSVGSRHPLYRELALIGRREKCLRPERLLAYECLLSSSEVVRCAGVEATNEQRAVCASRAIKTAIADLVEPNMRLVAQAVLCATSAFEGLSVRARMFKLADPPAVITRDQYWTLREAALVRIVEYLTSQNPRDTWAFTETCSRHDPSPTVEYDWQQSQAGQMIETLAKTSVNFYLMFLAYRFDVEHPEIPRQINKQREATLARWGISLPDLQRHSLSVEYLFRAYVAFAYRDYTPFVFIDAKRSTQELAAHNRELWNNLFVDSTPSLFYTIATAAHCDPFDHAHHGALERCARRDPLDGSDNETAADIYYNVWWPWFMHQNTLAAGHPSGIEVLAEKARAVFDFLDRVIPTATSYELTSSATQMAYITLSRIYGRSLDKGFHNTLRDRAAQYFGDHVAVRRPGVL